MSGFFGGIWWFIVVLGVLVTFHEFGHYWVARRCGVKVLKFSVGFGRALWSRSAKNGTVYQVAMIPLGGYVKFADERDDDVLPKDIPFAFNRQPVLKRIAIVAAGPVANLILCVALIWTSFVLGRPDLKPAIGPTKGLAAEAGLRDGDRIVSLDGQDARDWNDAVMPLFLAAVDHRAIALDVVGDTGGLRHVLLRLDRLPADFNQEQWFDAIGLVPLSAQNRPIVGAVADGAAARGILQPGDEILSLNEQPVPSFTQLVTMLQQASPRGQPVRLSFRRGTEVQQADISPKLVQTQGKPVWQLGIAVASQEVIRRHGPVDAVGEALSETARQTRQTFAILGRLVTGRASTKNLSGAIGIAQAAKAEANNGLSRLLFLMASLSLTLCIINLLPIPVLDGGHLLYYLIELVSGRPVSESVMAMGQVAGLVVLAGLIVLANFNDLLRIF